MFVAENMGDTLENPVILELHDDGIHSESYLGQAVYKYTAVGDIVGNGDHTYVFLGKDLALVLPKDRIPKDQLDEFVREVGERKASALRAAEGTA